MPKDGGLLDWSNALESGKRFLNGSDKNPNPGNRQATKQQWGDYLAAMGGSSKPKAKAANKSKAQGAAKKKAPIVKQAPKKGKARRGK